MFIFNYSWELSISGTYTIIYLLRFQKPQTRKSQWNFIICKIHQYWLKLKTKRVDVNTINYRVSKYLSFLVCRHLYSTFPAYVLSKYWWRTSYETVYCALVSSIRSLLLDRRYPHNWLPHNSSHRFTRYFRVPGPGPGSLKVEATVIANRGLFSLMIITKYIIYWLWLLYGSRDSM